MGDVIPFEKETVKEYLDRCIRHWRGEKKAALPKQGGRFKHLESTDELMATCYIDAFQSVRMTIFDELLPKD